MAKLLRWRVTSEQADASIDLLDPANLPSRQTSKFQRGKKTFLSPSSRAPHKDVTPPAKSNNADDSNISYPHEETADESWLLKQRQNHEVVQQKKRTRMLQNKSVAHSNDSDIALSDAEITNDSVELNTEQGEPPATEQEKADDADADITVTDTVNTPTQEEFSDGDQNMTPPMSTSNHAEDEAHVPAASLAEDEAVSNKSRGSRRSRSSVTRKSELSAPHVRRSVAASATFNVGRSSDAGAQAEKTAAGQKSTRRAKSSSAALNDSRVQATAASTASRDKRKRSSDVVASTPLQSAVKTGSSRRGSGKRRITNEGDGGSPALKSRSVRSSMRSAVTTSPEPTEQVHDQDQPVQRKSKLSSNNTDVTQCSQTSEQPSDNVFEAINSMASAQVTPRNVRTSQSMGQASTATHRNASKPTSKEFEDHPIPVAEDFLPSAESAERSTRSVKQAKRKSDHAHAKPKAVDTQQNVAKSIRPVSDSSGKFDHLDPTQPSPIRPNQSETTFHVPRVEPESVAVPAAVLTQRQADVADVTDLEPQCCSTPVRSVNAEKVKQKFSRLSIIPPAKHGPGRSNLVGQLVDSPRVNASRRANSARQSSLASQSQSTRRQNSRRLSSAQPNRLVSADNLLSDADVNEGAAVPLGDAIPEADEDQSSTAEQGGSAASGIDLLCGPRNAKAKPKKRRKKQKKSINYNPDMDSEADDSDWETIGQESARLSNASSKKTIPSTAKAAKRGSAAAVVDAEPSLPMPHVDDDVAFAVASTLEQDEPMMSPLHQSILKDTTKARKRSALPNVSFAQSPMKSKAVSPDESKRPKRLRRLRSSIFSDESSQGPSASSGRIDGSGPAHYFEITGGSASPSFDDSTVSTKGNRAVLYKSRLEPEDQARLVTPEQPEGLRRSKRARPNRPLYKDLGEGLLYEHDEQGFLQIVGIKQVHVKDPFKLKFGTLLPEPAHRKKVLASLRKKHPRVKKSNSKNRNVSFSETAIGLPGDGVIEVEHPVTGEVGEYACFAQTDPRTRENILGVPNGPRSLYDGAAAATNDDVTYVVQTEADSLYTGIIWLAPFSEFAAESFNANSLVFQSFFIIKGRKLEVTVADSTQTLTKYGSVSICPEVHYRIRNQGATEAELTFTLRKSTEDERDARELILGLVHDDN